MIIDRNAGELTKWLRGRRKNDGNRCSMRNYSNKLHVTYTRLSPAQDSDLLKNKFLPMSELGHTLCQYLHWDCIGSFPLAPLGVRSVQ
jgi:hypothetical protein